MTKKDGEPFGRSKDLFDKLFGKEKEILPITVVRLSKVEQMMQEVEKERMERDSRKMFEAYGKWYDQFTLVRSNFDALDNVITSFVDNIPNWGRFPRGKGMTVSGLGFAFDMGTQTHRRGIRFNFPENGDGLGDERRLGLCNICKSGPTRDPYQMFSDTNTTPDLRRMLVGSERLLDTFNGSRFYISAYAPSGRFDADFSSDDLVHFLDNFSLAEIFEKLMIAINSDDLPRNAKNQGSQELRLLVSGNK